MSARNQTQRVASVEDADESGNIIEGTDRYAESVASPTRERPNTSRARREKLGRDSPSPISGGLTDSDSTIHPISPLRRGSRTKPSRETRERKEIPLSNSQKRSSNKQAVIAMRPAPKHSHTNPDYGYGRRSDEASYYGVPTTTVTAASSRSRPQPSRQRPASYYGPPSRPPQANARFYAHPPPSAPLPTSYPPPPWAAGPVVYPGAPPTPAPQGDYFSAPRQQNLMARFSRPQSAMGHRPTQAIAYDYEEEDSRPLVKRASVSRKAKADQDRRTMPPPARPASARPTTLAFRPPPTTPARRSVAFDDSDLGGDPDLFRDISPLAQYNYSPPAAALQRTRRPSIGATSVSYDTGPYRTEVATSRPNRRHSYLGNQSVSSGSGYEDKMRQAAAYQNDIDGGPTMPLTAESLRKASKNGGSSRSTRSSGSHDDSEYRRSATTRTTRSSGNGGNDEDVTIRVKGQALLKVGGAEMQCQDGAEINITRGPGGYGGSDKSSYVDIEDRRSRMERPQARIRSSSQAGSYSRSTPRYDTPLSRYDNNGYQYPPPPAIPPYPAYPSRFENEF